MITIVDYGMGNLRSVSKALEAAGAEVRFAADGAALEGAEKVVLPGVGAFADAMEALRTRGLVDPLSAHLQADRPFLGICLGLQLLFEAGEEGGVSTPGLGWLGGRVVRFELTAGPDGNRLPVPHMGWNAVRKLRDDPLLAGVPDDSYFYFLHSFYVVPTDADARLTETAYPEPFCSAIGRGRVYATQFHPEKSQSLGLQVLRNFVSL